MKINSYLKYVLLGFLFSPVFYYALINRSSLGAECPPSCNVILISVDSLRADRMGLYGYKKNSTPNIDKWAKKAVIFDKYYNQAFLTPISETVAHTSLHPIESGVTRFNSVLPEKFKMMAEYLKAGGLKTVALGSSPEFFHFSVGMRENFQRGFDEYYTEYSTEELQTWGRTFRDETEAPFSWIEDKANTKDPFFMWLTIGTVHWPYAEGDFPGKKEYSGFLKGSSLSWSNHLRKIYNDKVWSITSLGEIERDLEKSDKEYLENAYVANIVKTDLYIGNFFDLLKKEGLHKNTIIIFHSEHGEELGEHGYYAHYDIYNTTIHSPLIIKIPGQKPKRVESSVGSIDILPTVLDYLDFSPAQQAKGLSLRPLIKGGSSGGFEDRTIYSTRIPLWEHLAPNYSKIDSAKEKELDKKLLDPYVEFKKIDKNQLVYDVGAIKNNWKLVWRVSRDVQMKYGWWRKISGAEDEIEEYELYNLLIDPQEQNNVYLQNTEIAESLRIDLEEWLSRQLESVKEVKYKGDILPYY
ncbi:hypothetical protein COB52_01770 [Candidatus Kaiserbacteria bacterium]|nr:MAG: hypothetical protein COB52_01770 [Candidatus Kaiserbacteria bacterium]